MITLEQFYDHKEWGRFSKTCPNRTPNDFDAGEFIGKLDGCLYIDEKTGGGYGGPCCYTCCLGWLDQLSEADKKTVLEDMDRQAKEYDELRKREVLEHGIVAGEVKCTHCGSQRMKHYLEDVVCLDCGWLTDWFEAHKQFELAKEVISG